MNTVVRFENISKCYKLGLTRASLPGAIAELLRGSEKRSLLTSDRILWALKDVSFDLKEGQSLGLIGPNGAGKSTILKLLASVTKPSSGRLVINGKLSALIELGAGFHPDLTGRENIFLNGTILGLRHKEIEKRFDEIVDFSELARFIDTPVKRYSSGMTIRLGFAVASCVEPAILLVDEVLAVGDASFQQKCLSRIRSLINNGTSIIFVSHNLYLVQAACSSALYLQQGRVKHIGAIRDVFDSYERDIHYERTLKFERSQSEDHQDENYTVDITQVEILNAQGKQAVLHSDQPAKIRMHYIAYKSLGKAQVAVFIYRSDGASCCMMRTKLDGIELYFDRGNGVITVELNPLQLVGGTYYAEAFVLNESDSMMITSKASRSDWFTVQGKALSHNESSVFEPNTHWKHYPDNASVTEKTSY